MYKVVWIARYRNDMTLKENVVIAPRLVGT